MNGRFKRMLEPGERILVRSTDGGVAWYLAGAFLALIALTWVRSVWGTEFLGFRFWKATLAFLAFAPLGPIAAWLWTQWKWVITDRRVLKGYGMFSRDIGKMRNETVNTVRLDDTTLSVYGGDYRWDLEISRAFCRADTLYGLFGARMGDPGLPATPLEEMLEPSETVIWRHSPLITDLLPWLVLFSGPLTLLIVMKWPEIHDYLYFGLDLVLIPYVMLLAGVIAGWRRRGWRIVLTDQRLLRRRTESPSRCDAVPLDSVTEAYWDSKGWELVVVSPGRRDTIFCLPWTARRILDALERNDRGEALA